MGSSEEGGYDLAELFVIKLVLADVIIVAALVFAGPLTAVAITALLVVSVFLVWYLTRRVDGGRASDSSAAEATPSTHDAGADDGTAVDPVTTLQERYASGELSEAEFERTLDQLLAADERAEEAGVETKRLSLERE